MKRIIRRYANRKMYDPKAGRPITLSGIARLLKDGAEIQVIDHPSGLDITALTLSKVLMVQQRNRTQSPQGTLVFQELISHRGHALFELAERSLRASLEVIIAVEGRFREMVHDLARSQKIDQLEGQRLLDRTLTRLAESKEILRLQLERVLGRTASAAGIGPASGGSVAEQRTDFSMKTGNRKKNKERME